jgi:hypothetical protein
MALVYDNLFPFPTSFEEFQRLFPELVENRLIPIYKEIKYFQTLIANSNDPEQIEIYTECIQDAINDGAEIIVKQLTESSLKRW